ncbi:hypothetical protein R1flu_017658 [Riccia fluitans]|uniref:Uncharacterized protein n=1 Tax=Riccia fluitans TaxID=41844 RepID=A0ABD1ZDK7_9MARC
MAEASRLRMQLRTTICHSISMQSSVVGVSQPRRTSIADSPPQPPLQRHKIVPSPVLMLEIVVVPLATPTFDPPANPSDRTE